MISVMDHIEWLARIGDCPVFAEQRAEQSYREWFAAWERGDILMMRAKLNQENYWRRRALPAPPIEITTMDDPWPKWIGTDSRESQVARERTGR